jgi:hypothetical protein
MTNPVTPRTALTEAEADALSTLAHVAISTAPKIQIQSAHASALLNYMSRLEVERNELRSALTASEKRVTELETENRHLRAEVYE